MFRKFLSLAVAALLTQAAYARPAAAGTKAEEEARPAERVKAGIAKLGIGPRARVEVKLRDKTRLKGYVGEATADYFTVVDEAGLANRVAYPQVTGVKGHNLSEGARIAIVAGIVVASILIALAAAGGT
ncbi:MAG TPA: hypothetical protein VN282_14230 [Pyrinomonadaceae bacterium]|nr:hypothetical protein [Pyrinomonadaceae bacterium]